jgi:GxxExxY protein
MPHDVNFLTGRIIGSAIEVHRELGPGLLESTYRLSLGRELELQNIPVKVHWPVPFEYKGVRFRKVYQADLIVADTVVVETKSVDALHPIHEAQLLTYLRIGGWKVGLLINFNEIVLKNGIRRKVLNLPD